MDRSRCVANVHTGPPTVSDSPEQQRATNPMDDWPLTGLQIEASNHPDTVWLVFAVPPDEEGYGRAYSAKLTYELALQVQGFWQNGQESGQVVCVSEIEALLTAQQPMIS
jgi:hypothetical protein